VQDGERRALKLLLAKTAASGLLPEHGTGLYMLADALVLEAAASGFAGPSSEPWLFGKGRSMNRAGRRVWERARLTPRQSSELLLAMGLLSPEAEAVLAVLDGRMRVASRFLQLDEAVQRLAPPALITAGRMADVAAEGAPESVRAAAQRWLSELTDGAAVGASVDHATEAVADAAAHLARAQLASNAGSAVAEAAAWLREAPSMTSRPAADGAALAASQAGLEPTVAQREPEAVEVSAPAAAPATPAPAIAHEPEPAQGALLAAKGRSALLDQLAKEAPVLSKPGTEAAGAPAAAGWAEEGAEGGTGGLPGPGFVPSKKRVKKARARQLRHEWGRVADKRRAEAVAQAARRAVPGQPTTEAPPAATAPSPAGVRVPLAGQGFATAPPPPMQGGWAAPPSAAAAVAADNEGAASPFLAHLGFAAAAEKPRARAAPAASAAASRPGKPQPHPRGRRSGRLAAAPAHARAAVSSPRGPALPFLLGPPPAGAAAPTERRAAIAAATAPSAAPGSPTPEISLRSADHVTAPVSRRRTTDVTPAPPACPPAPPGPALREPEAAALASLVAATSGGDEAGAWGRGPRAAAAAALSIPPGAAWATEALASALRTGAAGAGWLEASMDACRSAVTPPPRPGAHPADASAGHDGPDAAAHFGGFERQSLSPSIGQALLALVGVRATPGGAAAGQGVTAAEADERERRGRADTSRRVRAAVRAALARAPPAMPTGPQDARDALQGLRDAPHALSVGAVAAAAASLPGVAAAAAGVPPGAGRDEALAAATEAAQALLRALGRLDASELAVGGSTQRPGSHASSSSSSASSDGGGARHADGPVSSAAAALSRSLQPRLVTMAPGAAAGSAAGSALGASGPGAVRLAAAVARACVASRAAHAASLVPDDGSAASAKAAAALLELFSAAAPRAASALAEGATADGGGAEAAARWGVLGLAWGPADSVLSTVAGRTSSAAGAAEEAALAVRGTAARVVARGSDSASVAATASLEAALDDDADGDSGDHVIWDAEWGGQSRPRGRDARMAGLRSEAAIAEPALERA